MPDTSASGSDSATIPKVQRDRRGTAFVLHVAGEVDLSSVALLPGALAEVPTDAGALTALVLDLRDVTFLSSIGLSVLVE